MQNIFRETKAQLTFWTGNTLDFPAHVHDDIELVYVRKGRATAYCDGQKYELKERDFLLVFPNQIHHYADSIPGEYIVLTVKPSLLAYYNSVFLEGHPQSAHCSFAETDDDHIIFLLETALGEYQRDGGNGVIYAYISLILGKLLRFYRIEKNRLPQNLVLSILQYCAQHYRENISISDIAEELHISRSHISRIFGSRLKISFCDYINSLRLNDAVELLENRSYSITQIANMSGFPTIRTFNRAFVKRYGVSPSQYRETI